MRHYDIQNAKLHDVVVFMNHEAEIVFIDPKHLLLDLGCGVLNLVRKENALLYKKPLAKLDGEEIYSGDAIYYGLVKYIADFVSDRFIHFKGGSVERVIDGDIYNNFCSTTPFVNIRGFKVPAPLQGPPAFNTTVFYPSLTSPEKWYSFTWRPDSQWGRDLLDRGLLWETSEGPIAYIDALYKDI